MRQSYIYILAFITFLQYEVTQCIIKYVLEYAGYVQPALTVKFGFYSGETVMLSFDVANSTIYQYFLEDQTPWQDQKQ